jgi:hypothetical protein
MEQWTATTQVCKEMADKWVKRREGNREILQVNAGR